MSFAVINGQSEGLFSALPIKEPSNDRFGGIRTSLIINEKIPPFATPHELLFFRPQGDCVSRQYFRDSPSKRMTLRSIFYHQRMTETEKAQIRRTLELIDAKKIQMPDELWAFLPRMVLYNWRKASGGQSPEFENKFNEHIATIQAYRQSFLPLSDSDPQISIMLKSGSVVWGGRDANLRPVLIVTLKRFPEDILGQSTFKKTVAFCFEYARRFLYVPGVIESCNVIIDARGVGLHQFPMSAMTELSANLSGLYPYSLERMWLISDAVFIHTIWSVFRQFLTDIQAQKVAFLKSATLSELAQYFAPSQLDKSLGGTKPESKQFYPFDLPPGPFSLGTRRINSNAIPNCHLAADGLTRFGITTWVDSLNKQVMRSDAAIPPLWVPEVYREIASKLGEKVADGYLVRESVCSEANICNLILGRSLVPMESPAAAAAPGPSGVTPSTGSPSSVADYSPIATAETAALRKRASSRSMSGAIPSCMCRGETSSSPPRSPSMKPGAAAAVLPLESVVSREASQARSGDVPPSVGLRLPMIVAARGGGDEGELTTTTTETAMRGRIVVYNKKTADEKFDGCCEDDNDNDEAPLRLARSPQAKVVSSPAPGFDGLDEESLMTSLSSASLVVSPRNLDRPPLGGGYKFDDPTSLSPKGRGHRSKSFHLPKSDDEEDFERSVGVEGGVSSSCSESVGLSLIQKTPRKTGWVEVTAASLEGEERDLCGDAGSGSIRARPAAADVAKSSKAQSGNRGGGFRLLLRHAVPPSSCQAHVVVATSESANRRRGLSERNDAPSTTTTVELQTTRKQEELEHQVSSSGGRCFVCVGPPPQAVRPPEMTSYSQSQSQSVPGMLFAHSCCLSPAVGAEVIV